MLYNRAKQWPWIILYSQRSFHLDAVEDSVIFVQLSLYFCAFQVFNDIKSMLQLPLSFKTNPLKNSKTLNYSFVIVL